MMGREPTGEELLEALIALRGRARPSSAAESEVVFEKLHFMWRRGRGFVTKVSQDAVVEAWMKAVESTFRGESPGEAVAWLSRVAYTVSVDEKRREKSERDGKQSLAAVRLVAADAPAEPATATVSPDQALSFLLELRDVRLPAFAAARFPKRAPVNLRVRIELAYAAAMERDEYLRALEKADPPGAGEAGRKARQALQKDMGRGRDELWLPFLEELARDPSLEGWQRSVVEELVAALLSTRREDHGRPRGGAGGDP